MFINMIYKGSVVSYGLLGVMVSAFGVRWLWSNSLTLDSM